MLPAAALEAPAPAAVAQVVRPAAGAPSPALRPLFEQLGWDWSRAGGLAGADLSLFFDELHEQREGRSCIVYRMKHPFIGELVKCGSRMQGEVGYAPGVLTWLGAGQRACALVASETGSACGNNGVEVLRNSLVRDAGGLSWRVLVRRWVRAHPEIAERGDVPVEYERRSYRLSLDGSRVELLERRRQLCGRACVPLP